jgi:hypothetical protein
LTRDYILFKKGYFFWGETLMVMKRALLSLLFASLLWECGGSRNLDSNMDSETYIQAVLEITNENFAKFMKKQNKKSGKKPASVFFYMKEKVGLQD